MRMKSSSVSRHRTSTRRRITPGIAARRVDEDSIEAVGLERPAALHCILLQRLGDRHAEAREVFAEPRHA
jgi:hypothetical protein